MMLCVEITMMCLAKSQDDDIMMVCVRAKVRLYESSRRYGEQKMAQFRQGNMQLRNRQLGKLEQSEYQVTL